MPCDCPTCTKVNAYRAAPAISRVPSTRDKITHAQHIVAEHKSTEVTTTTTTEGVKRAMHLFSSSMPPGYDPSTCHEYRGKTAGDCGKTAIDGLCTEHAEQRREL